MRAEGRRWDLRVGAVAAALAVVCASSLAFAARADAYIYWGDTNGWGKSIGRVAQDGSGANQNFINSPAWAVAVSQWGNPPQIYWTKPYASGIGRANIDGSNVNPNFISGSGYLGLAVDLDAKYIYWVGNHAIGRANIDGSGVIGSFIVMPDPAVPGVFGANPAAIAVDKDHIYWSDTVHGKIGRANLDGSNVNANFLTDVDPDLVEMGALAVEPFKLSIFHPNRFLYWYAENGYINTAYAVDGSHVNRDAIDPPGGTWGMVWDYHDGEHYLYWSDPYYGNIRRSPRDGSPIKTMASAAKPAGVTVDAAGPGGAPPALSVGAAPAAAARRAAVPRQRLRTALRRGVRRLRLRPPGSGRACLELRLRARTAKRLGLRPRRSERRLGQRVGRRRCLKITTPGTRKLVVRFNRRSRAALRKLLLRIAPRRLAALRRLVRHKGLTVQVRVVWRDALGYRHPTSRPVRLVR